MRSSCLAEQKAEHAANKQQMLHWHPLLPHNAMHMQSHIFFAFPLRLSYISPYVLRTVDVDHRAAVHRCLMC